MSFYDKVAGLLLMASLLGAVALALRQPLIVAFIATGILAGPVGLGLVTAESSLDLLASLGVTILLFVVGLKLDIHLVRNLGWVVLLIGFGQIGLSFALGFLLALALGMMPLTAFYLAVALTFSSTIIVVKLLSDRRELDSLHGRITMGVLIVQDLTVAIAMMVLSVFGPDAGNGIGPDGLLWLPLKLAVMLAGLLLLMRYGLPRLLHVIARSGELLMLVAVAWGATLASLGEMLGLSQELGALLAGFSLASTPFREAISTRLSSLRDFLLLFFFVDLGANLGFPAFGWALPVALALSIFILLGKPLIVMGIMGYLGYRRFTAFQTGLALAQISEFSFILVALGVSLGHIPAAVAGLVTLVGLVTITLSAYMIHYAHRLYPVLDPWLKRFERRHPHREEIELDEQPKQASRPVDIIIYGLGRYGLHLAERLSQRGLRVVGVDFNPDLLRFYRDRPLEVRFGDAEDPDFPETLPLDEARWVVSTLASGAVNLALLQNLRTQGYRGMVVLTAHNERDAGRLCQAGADRVLLPFKDAASFAAEIVADDVLVESCPVRPGRDAS
ncbi:cation:proton antiporter [Thermithiobacillus plumbiphilus]|uniref:Cation:proton antiporter n=1 Tax=Thermithiobacillus plumbiphilus TaxID=1729899 RepID=A0ABU9D9H0_9PROT